MPPKILIWNLRHFGNIINSPNRVSIVCKFSFVHIFYFYRFSANATRTNRIHNVFSVVYSRHKWMTNGSYCRVYDTNNNGNVNHIQIRLIKKKRFLVELNINIYDIPHLTTLFFSVADIKIK